MSSSGNKNIGMFGDGMGFIKKLEFRQLKEATTNTVESLRYEKGENYVKKLFENSSKKY
jgi:hypothetical protein